MSLRPDFAIHVHGLAAVLDAPGLPAEQYTMDSSQEKNSFAGTVTVTLPVSDPSDLHACAFHFGAGCHVSPNGHIDGSGDAVVGSGSCSVSVDPQIGFDQAAFDALMGENTVPPGDYFQLMVGDNLTGEPVPAGSCWLGWGLASLLSFYGWQRIRRTQT